MPSHAGPLKGLTVGDLAMMAIGTGAMMIPVGLRSARHVALSTFRDRRFTALMSFQLGYLLAPFALTLGASALFLATGAQGEPWLVPVLLLVAMAWQLTPWKVDALGRCARTIPLPAVRLRRPPGRAPSSAYVEAPDVWRRPGR